MATIPLDNNNKSTDKNKPAFVDVSVSKLKKIAVIGKYKPSEYIRERLLSTAQKLAQVSARIEIPEIIQLIQDKEGCVKNYEVSIDRPLFQPIPSTVVLQSFEPFVSYEVVISFRNIDKFTRRLKIEPIDSPYFSITGWKSNSLSSTKIAPGIEVSYVLKFKPEEKIDYSYDLICTSERERFIVPIRATGGRALMDFPDVISFSEVPVRYKSTKTILIRNIGSRDGKFKIESSEPFEFVPNCGFLKASCSMQLDVNFNPKCTGSYEKEVCIHYDTGEKIYIQALGVADDAIIRLEKSLVKLDSASIGLISIKTLKLINKSDIMSKFCWKMCLSESEENSYRSNQHIQLYKQELDEMQAYQALSPEEKKNDIRDVTLLNERYANIRKQIDSNLLNYQDSIFRIEPSNGSIWPGSEIDIKIFFHPQKSGHVSKTAYCEVEGREMRLPLQLKGEGIGPKGRFSYDLLDLEEIFINSSHHYDVLLENRGDIEFNFNLKESNTLFGPFFTFTPSNGNLAAGEFIKIDATFSPTILGDVYEEFSWELEGAPEPLTLTFKGKVAGPNLNFCAQELNFKTVAFGFSSSLPASLMNNSRIPVSYTLKVENEKGEKHPEFKIIPNSGKLLEMETCTFDVEFKPLSVQNYNLNIIVDIDEMECEAVRLPLRAISCIPEISLQDPNIGFGDCFINHLYQQNFVLVNNTSFPAKFEVLPQDSNDKTNIIFSSLTLSGVIECNSMKTIGLEVNFKTVGYITFFVKVRIVGSEIPITLGVSGCGIGPQIEFSNQELNWGKIPVLKKFTESIILKNTSPIPGNFTANIVGDSSVFDLDTVSGVIEPYSSAQVSITAFLDDCMKFTDILKVSIFNDKIYEIQMVARGQGSSVIVQEDLKNVDFGEVFSNKECFKEYKLSNKGRRPQTIVWSHEDKRNSDSLPFCFEIIPNRFLLKAGAEQTVMVKGYSTRSVRCTEKIICNSTVEREIQRKMVVLSTISANFICPLVETTPSLLKLHCSYSGQEQSFQDISQTLMIKNASSLTLDLFFKCPNPYMVNMMESMNLEPGAEKEIVVTYDPSRNSNRISAKEHSKLTILYLQHPQKDFVDLYSEVSFPNISLSTESVDFGSIVVHSEIQKNVIVKNSGNLPVHFKWSLIDKDKEEKKGIVLGQIFDILPNQGIVSPGEECTMTVIFYGSFVGSFKCRAACNVVGGPKYGISLIGESANIDYSIDRTKIDFGTRPYQDIIEQELFITNKGNVAFDFEFSIFQNSPLFQKLMILPSTGTLNPQQKLRIPLRFCNCAPETVCDDFYLKIAYFEPIPIRVTGRGVFNNILMDLPRSADSCFEKYIVKASNVLGLPINQVPCPENSSGTDQDILIQAENMYLSEKTWQYITKNMEDAQEIQHIANKLKNKFVGSLLLFSKGLDLRHTSLAETSKIFLSTYSCDFGCVIRNTTKKKVIKIFNRGHDPLNVNFDKGILVGTGFKIEPERIKMLQPNESINLYLTIYGRSPSGVRSKTTEVNVPMFIQGGPVISINMKATVTIPEITLSADVLNFGEVICGQRKTAFLNFTNSNAVPAEWTTEISEVLNKEKKPRRRGAASKWDEFTFVPNQGILQPGETITVKVLFIPNEDREYDDLVTITIGLNPKNLLVNLTGRGVKLDLHFDPDMLTLGPILPSGDGAEAKTYISNPTKHTIEVYSLEFDQQYLEEEILLQNIDSYEDGAIFIPIREAGSGLPDSIAEAARARIRLDLGAINNNESSESLDAPYPNSEKASLVSDRIRSAITNKSFTDDDFITAIIIHGPPYSGRSTQAKRVAKKFNLPQLSIDEILESSGIFEKGVQMTSKLSSLDISKLNDDLKPSSTENNEHPVTEEMISEVIQNRLMKEDCLKGYVIDGLESKFNISPLSILKILQKFYSDGLKKTFFLNFNLDISCIKEREALFQKLTIEKEIESLFVKELSEEEYDYLNEDEKYKYDHALNKLKMKLKEVDEKKRSQRKQMEEELASKAGIKDDGKKGIKAKPKVAAPPSRNDSKPLTAKEPTRKLNAKEKMGKPSDPDNAIATDLMEVMLSESTLRQYDNYSQNMDLILEYIKENNLDKNQIQGKAPQDKKKKQTVHAVQQPEFQNEPTSNLNLTEFSVNKEDLQTFEIHEISSFFEEEEVFKLLTDCLPKMEPPIEKIVDEKTLSDPVTEQIILYPERDAIVPSRYFTLLPTILDEDTVKKSRIAVKTEENFEADGEKLSGRFRWVISPGEKRELLIKFNTNEVGRFEQSLQFEITGYKQKFNLKLIGISQHSHIVNDPKKIFAKTRKSRDEKTILNGEYVFSTSTFEFGPLLYSKPRDKYLEKYPENHAIITLTNPCLHEIKALLCLKNDIKGDVFFFEPNAIDLAPGQSQNINIWAYPKTNHHFEDVLVVCIKDNPQPYLFKISCIGVKPELELDKKSISFDKLLLGRLDKRELRLRNPTHMPISWKLSGIDGLGEEFEVWPVEGVIESFQEVIVNAEFCGSKPCIVKRIIRIEISDVEKISGVVNEIQILVTAEAYDIAVDLHFPKGYEGGLDFGALKVFDEGKQLCTMKNKGKYEVGFRLIFENSDISELFTTSPQQGILQPSDKPFFIQFIFKANREIVIKDNISCKCQIFEPSTDEVTALFPIKLSARAVFSKFTISPAHDLNFGSLIFGSKSAKQIVLENCGEFDYRYSIYKTVSSKTSNKLKVAGSKNNIRALSPNINKIKGKPEVPVSRQTDSLNFGAFSVFPTSANIVPGTKQVVNVEFHGESPTSYEEVIAIDISDRSPFDYPDPIEYKLIGESCIPGINTSDLSSIFEEHALCKRLEVFASQSNVYAEEDKVFYFGAFLVGQQVSVRFKITNPFKVPCELSICTKQRSKSKNDSADFAFDVEPKKMIIPSHENRYITATFHPTSIQMYAGIFEAVVDNVLDNKNKTLSFELRGEGTLPRLSLEKPTIKSKNGNPLLKFKRLILGSSQTLQLLVRNDGIIPTKFKLEWITKDSDDFECPSINSQPYLRPSESKLIDIKFAPSSLRKLEAELKIRVPDNAYEDILVSLAGEGFMEDLIFEVMSQDSENEIIFGDCHIGETKHISFKLINHSSEILRISFPEIADFAFQPPAFHLHSKSDKTINVSFTAKQPIDVHKLQTMVKSLKIKMKGEVSDYEWEDRNTSGKWDYPESAEVSQFSKRNSDYYIEPSYEPIGNVIEYPFFITAFADFSSFECDVNEIVFKTTMMFQKRRYSVAVRNNGRVSLKLNILLFNENGIQIESDEPNVFTVTPLNPIIEPGSVMNCIVQFAPDDVGKYCNTMLILVENLSKESKPHQISIKASSQRPLCHFELEDSDYISNERRIPEVSTSDGMQVSMDPTTRVIEMFSCGIKVKNIKRFYIVNPTDLGYEFEWICGVSNDKCFKCLTTKGMVAANKKYEIIFEFYPEDVDIKESMWTFRIIDHDLRVPFLLVGQATEPNVYMDKTAVNFKSILTNHKIKEIVKLVNNEEIPFNFSFNETSFELNTNGTPVLSFFPTSGIVGPNSEMPIEINFYPCSEKTFNFNLVCNVKKKPTNLSINVKGEGYGIHDSLEIELSDGSIAELVSGLENENSLDFGQIQLNEKRIRRVAIINSGKYNFDFYWKLPAKYNNCIKMHPEIGTVQKGEKLLCEIIFLPTYVMMLKNFKAVCQIVNGKSYGFQITGAGSKPNLKFSCSEVNFGDAFIIQGSVMPISSSVLITNQDGKEMTIDISSPQTENFIFNISKNVLQPGETASLEILFYPRESKKYLDSAKIEVNGILSADIKIVGEGIEFKVEPISLEHKSINFGAVRVGGTVVRAAKIINRSSVLATFSIGPSATIENLSALGFRFSHSGLIDLKPKAILIFEMIFQPQTRIPAFSEDLMIESASLGYAKHLYTILGACQGIEVHFESDSLPFGAVVQKSSTSRRIQLQNVGDIGAKFSLEPSQFWPDFSISPSDGYISPGMDVSLEIDFHPKDINPDIRYENIECHVEGMSPLYLTLSGMCIPPPLQSEPLKFTVPVRASEVKSISLTNKTNVFWHIRPIFDNPYWTGAEYLEAEPGQTKQYDITFTPLETVGTGDGGRHDGSVFFPIPDGTGILYKMIGIADKPLSIANINRDIPCKTNHLEIISVPNWAKKAQRFKVMIEVVKPEYVTIKGADFIDIPPLMTKDYKLNFYSYKEGVVSAKIVFKNEQNQEYSYWNLTYRSTPPGTLSTIEICTATRQLATKDLTIFNPLLSPVSFSVSSTHQEINVPHTLTAAAKSDCIIPIEFLPLAPKESQGKITINSADLGVYVYDLKLVSTPAPPERSMHFKVGLGGFQTLSFRFLSYSKVKTEYVCKIEHSDFTVEKTISAAGSVGGGVEVSLEVTYEPSHLGDSRTQLIVSSAIGGEYICPLFGHCIAPRPQGPIFVKTGFSTVVPFKNVFGVATTFNFIVDNPAFVIKSSESIPAKKSIQLSLIYKTPALLEGKDKASTPKVGKLTITTTTSPVVWVYYLKVAN